jgi:hypothetical protein
MKTLILAAFFLIIFCTAESQSKVGLNYENGKYKYVEIKALPDLTSDVIYSRVVDWVAFTFTNTESVIQAQVENKMIRLKGVSRSGINGLMGNKFDVGYTIQVDVKDNKLKITASKIQAIAQVAPYTRTSLEIQLRKLNGKERTSKIAKSTYTDVSQLFTDIADDLAYYIINPKNESDNW